MTARFGTPRVHLRRTGSTNERARELALGGAPHGALVTADEQTSGRGRQGRAWTAPPREAVLMSVVLREFEPVLPLAAAVAICEALPVECAIKWPNDVWHDGRKLAGILVEGRPQEGWAVLGIGLNVSTTDFPQELAVTGPPRFASPAARLVDGGAVLNRLLGALANGWRRRPSAVLAAWRRRDALLGETVRWNGGEGTAAGIDESGALLVDGPAGPVKLDAGEVHLRPS